MLILLSWVQLFHYLDYMIIIIRNTSRAHIAGIQSEHTFYGLAVMESFIM